jgi:two-component system chemotaxis response regulator CheY
VGDAAKEPRLRVDLSIHQTAPSRQSFTRGTIAAQQVPAEDSMQQTVIIADDAQFMRGMLKDILEDMDCRIVAEVADGEEAVARYLELRPDLIMLDITMPLLDGVEACRRIVAADPEAQVVMISALGQKDEVLEAVRAGACDFVIKPFESERVEETLRQVQSRRLIGS